MNEKPLGFISPLSCIGEPPEHREYRWLVLRGEFFPLQPIISSSAVVEAFVTVDAGIHQATFIGDEVMLMKHSHVGHDSVVSHRCNIAPGAIIGGHCSLGEGVKVGLGASIRPRVRVGDFAVIGAGAVVVKDVPAGEIWAGNPARKLPQNVSPSESETDPWMEWYYSWHNAERG